MYMNYHILHRLNTRITSCPPRQFLVMKYPHRNSVLILGEYVALTVFSLIMWDIDHKVCFYFCQASLIGSPESPFLNQVDLHHYFIKFRPVVHLYILEQSSIEIESGLEEGKGIPELLDEDVRVSVSHHAGPTYAVDKHLVLVVLLVYITLVGKSHQLNPLPHLSVLIWRGVYYGGRSVKLLEKVKQIPDLTTSLHNEGGLEGFSELFLWRIEVCLLSEIVPDRSQKVLLLYQLVQFKGLIVIREFLKNPHDVHELLGEFLCCYISDGQDSICFLGVHFKRCKNRAQLFEDKFFFLSKSLPEFKHRYLLLHSLGQTAFNSNIPVVNKQVKFLQHLLH